MEKIIYLEHAPWLKLESLCKLFDIFEKAGFDIRPVGGCIRDSLLNIKANDWDLTTNAQPEESLKICQNASLHVIPTGLKHGTITAILNDTPFEITTLRIDQKTNGRHADVVWTNDWNKDAARRDFTINALYGDKQGYIHDYYDGISDLKKGIIRFVGRAENRVQEDYLRILRYFRFMAYFADFSKIHEDSLHACIHYKEALQQISSERIYSEIMKILIAPQRHKAITLMEESGIFNSLNLPLKTASLQILDDREKHLTFSKSALRALAFILEPKSEWHKVANRLKFSNKEKKHLNLLQKYIDLQPSLTKEILRKIAYFHGLEIAQDLYILKAQPHDEKISHWDEIIPPPFPITGQDLTLLGITPGKNMGEILKNLEEEYVRSDFSLSQDQLLENIKP